MPNKTPLPPSDHLHAHHRGDAHHTHTGEARSAGVLGWSVLLTLGFAAIEAGVGLWANSLALISDAGHMITDASALGLALLAQYIAKRPPSARLSFGYGRAEALAAFVNGLLMLAMIGWISIEAVTRLSHPEAVKGQAVMIVAAIGLAVNVVVAWVLSHDRSSMNTRAALVHVLGDMLGSVAALVAGAVIWWTGWLGIDPLLSLFVCALLLKSTFGVLGESYHFLMQGVPDKIDYLQVGDDLKEIDGVLSVHDLHVWEMAPGHPALICHVEVKNLQEWPDVLARIKAMLLSKHGIDHITMQAEAAGD